MNKVQHILKTIDWLLVLFLCLPIVLFVLAGWDNVKSWILDICSFVWVVGLLFSLGFMWAASVSRKAKQKADSPFPEHALQLQSLEEAYMFMFRSAISAVIGLLTLWIAANGHRYP